MTQIPELGPVEVRKLDDIVPYWRNPRTISEEDVNRLAESIKSFGYQQPIVVDAKGVIIVGHTRYAALRKLKVDAVPVMIATSLTEDQVKAYRVVDNKAAEFTTWDFDLLQTEIEQLDGALVNTFFPEISLVEEVITQEEANEQKVRQEWDKVQPETEFTCTNCYHSFKLEVKRDEVMTGTIGKVPQ